MPRSRAAAPSQFAGLAVALALTGCGGRHEPGLRPAPSRLVTTPDRPVATLALHNDGDTPRRISRLRLGGADWDGFLVTGEHLPELVPAHGSVQIGLQASAAAFRREDSSHHFDGYSPASASVDFLDEGAPRSVPIEFREASAWRSSAAPTAGAGLVLCALAWAFTRPFGRARAARAPSAGSTTRRVRVAAAFAAALVAFAFVPVGDALCPAELGALADALALAQCRASLGGAPMQVSTAEGSLLLWLIAMAVAGFACARAGGERATACEREAGSHEEAGVVALASVLVAALALAPLALAAGSFETHTLARQAIDARGLLAPAGWGIVTQPLGFAILAAVAILDRRGTASNDRGHRLARSLRLRSWSAMIAALYLGAWSIPSWAGYGVASHASMVAVGALVFASKWLLIDQALSRIARSRWISRLDTPGRRARLLLTRLAPLALLNLCASVLLR